MARKTNFSNKSEFGKAILSELEKRNKSQLWLANQCGVSNGQINHVISGRSAPSYKLLCNISKTLKVKADTLLK